MNSSSFSRLCRCSGVSAADVEIGIADQPIRVLVLFVGTEGEDRRDAQIVLPGFALGFELLVILDQHVDAADRHHGREVLAVGLAAMVGDDPVDDAFSPVRVLEEFPGVDARDLLVDQAAVLAPELAPVFDREFEDVLVADGVGDDILVQLLAEQILCRALAERVPAALSAKIGVPVKPNICAC